MLPIHNSQIMGVYHVTPARHDDERGWFSETYRREWFPEAREMIQSNRVERDEGCIVGLHLHLHQADYWYVVKGVARVVLHDMRRDSSTERATINFDMADGQGVYIPPGVAHGFSTPHGPITLTYLVDSYYNPPDELGVAWDDPVVGADWGWGGLTDPPVLSERDLYNLSRSAVERIARNYDHRGTNG